MEHHFDVELAKIYGIEEAIIFNHMEFWIAHNEANQINEFEGDYWTFNSTKAWVNIFPYWNERKIKRILDNMCEEKLLKKGNFNKITFDRTLWYTFGEIGINFHKNENVHLQNFANDIYQNLQMTFTKNGKPIPDNIKDNIKDNNYIYSPTSQKMENGQDTNIYESVIEFLNQKAHTNYKASSSKTKKLLHARISEGFKLDDFKTVIQKKCEDWLGTDYEKYLRPETLFGTKFENYLNQKSKSKSLPDWYSYTNQTKPNDELLKQALELQKRLGG